MASMEHRKFTFQNNNCVISIDEVEKSDIIIDCNSLDAFKRAHIPGAQHLGTHGYLKEDNTHQQPTRVCTAEQFAKVCANLGITADSKVVTYDGLDGVLASRVWWVFTYYGHKNTRMLDGGWKKWAIDNRPYEADVKKTTSSVNMPNNSSAVKESVKETFVPTIGNPNMIITASELKNEIGNIQIWDCRNYEENQGTQTRNNPRQGAIPTAKFLKWVDLVDGESHLLLPREEIREKLEKIGLDLTQPIVTHCQSGIRSAHSAMVAEFIGVPIAKNYDGSMGEWSRLPDEEYPLENQKISN